MRFEESQRFTQSWIWVLIAIASTPIWFIFIWQIILGRPVGNNPMPDGLVIVLVLFVGMGLPLMFYILRLKVSLEESGIRIIMRPWTNRFIPYTDILLATVRNYSPLREYGGWGIRWSFKNGMAYNVSGSRGVQLVLKNGKRILIGSQHSEELAAAINTNISINNE